jgi:DNA-binding response OmpR family regulator
MLKDNPELATMPIILLTSKGQAIDIKAGLAAGADEYIVKPFSVIHLIEVALRQLSITQAVAA